MPGSSALQKPTPVRTLKAAYASGPRASRTVRPYGQGQVVGTRSYMPISANAPSGFTSRTRHALIGSPTDLRLAYANITPDPNGNGEDPTTTITVKAAVEFISDANTKVYPVTFRGQLVGTIDPGGVLTSDPIGFDVRAQNSGTYVYVRTYATVPSGNLPRTHQTSTSRNEGSVTGDLTATGSAAITASNGLAYGPTAIVGSPATDIPQIAVVGDSRLCGYGESFVELDYVSRALNDQYAYQRIALNGDRPFFFQYPQGHYRRMPWINGSTHGICNYGINDIIVGGSTLWSQVAQNAVGVWKVVTQRVAKLYQTTLEPVSTSTDSWATTTNQTTHSGNAARTGFNDWLRDGAPMLNGTYVAAGSNATGTVRAGQAGHPLVGVIEVADLAESARNSGLWKPNYTVDGTHASTTGNTAMAAAIIPAALFT